MKIRFLFVLTFICLAGCISNKGQYAKALERMVSLPEARARIVAYYESRQYDKDVAAKAETVVKAVKNALSSNVKYPAVVMVVEDVLLSTYKARKIQGFSDNDSARKSLESNVILSVLPAVKPSVDLFEFLLLHNIPVFLISHRSESFRVSVMENLSKAGFSGWKSLYMYPPHYPADLNYYEEVRKGLHKTGFNVIATVGILPVDVDGEFSGKFVIYPNYLYSNH
ncbi:HAD family acid phosphatase [Maridesulfovibrio zosterae]|uniref:HAD family acid phosphatase n=1 Tax=Maridesulfovibrio zosterae TaxID=82171 RepID=UPI000414D3CA|nr:HAD family acid phosphatase [Maridesulfovibrio zosterae]